MTINLKIGTNMKLCNGARSRTKDKKGILCREARSLCWSGVIFPNLSGECLESNLENELRKNTNSEIIANYNQQLSHTFQHF